LVVEVVVEVVVNAGGIWLAGRLEGTVGVAAACGGATTFVVMEVVVDAVSNVGLAGVLKKATVEVPVVDGDSSAGLPGGLSLCKGVEPDKDGVAQR
jgi:hypothetical protein